MSLASSAKGARRLAHWYVALVPALPEQEYILVGVLCPSRDEVDEVKGFAELVSDELRGVECAANVRARVLCRFHDKKARFELLSLRQSQLVQTCRPLDSHHEVTAGLEDPAQFPDPEALLEFSQVREDGDCVDEIKLAIREI